MESDKHLLIVDLATDFDIIFRDAFSDSINRMSSRVEEGNESQCFGLRVCTMRPSYHYQSYGTIDDVEGGHAHIIYDSEHEEWQSLADPHTLFLYPDGEQYVEPASEADEAMESDEFSDEVSKQKKHFLLKEKSVPSSIHTHLIECKRFRDKGFSSAYHRSCEIPAPGRSEAQLFKVLHCVAAVRPQRAFHVLIQVSIAVRHARGGALRRRRMVPRGDNALECCDGRSSHRF